jgi:hypothetical protein
MGANPLLEPLERAVLENLNFLGAKWHLLRFALSGPKKAFSGPTPSNGACYGFARIKINKPCGI